MSVVFGIVGRKGEQISESELSLLYNSVNHYPHESYLGRSVGNVAFGILQTSDTGMPHYNDTDKLFFVAQGRIDNRIELCQLLGNSENQLTDEELMFQTYLRFGDDTPDKLLGDWSFAVYDCINQKLFMAQAPCGLTSFYYFIDSERVIFSNRIKPLLTSVFVPDTLDQHKIISKLALVEVSDPDATFYESIKLLNPAHKMWVDATTYRKERYWFPESLPVLHDITLEDAAEHLREIFTEAVRCRLKGDKPVASMLSGGLDSGSVAVIASDLLKKEGKSFSTFSHVPLFDIDEDRVGLDRFGDERPYINATVKHNGNIVPSYLDSAELTPLQAIRTSLDVFEEPIFGAANAYWILDIFLQAREGGFGTLLSGEMGNATISWTGVPYALNGSQFLQIYGFKAFVKQKWLRPLFFGYVKPLLSPLNNKHLWQEYIYLTPEYTKQFVAEERKRQSGKPTSTNSDAKEQQLQILMLGHNPRYRFGAAISHYYGVEKRDPTSDKRVIEFLLQLPNELFLSESGENKQLIKRMMKDILPDKVLFQKKKGLQTSDLIERIQADLGEIEGIIAHFSTDIISDAFFDKRRMLSDLQLLKEKKLTIGKTVHLLRTIGIMEFLNRHKNSNKAERV